MTASEIKSQLANNKTPYWETENGYFEMTLTHLNGWYTHRVYEGASMVHKMRYDDMNTAISEFIKTMNELKAIEI